MRLLLIKGQTTNSEATEFTKISDKGASRPRASPLFHQYFQERIFPGTHLPGNLWGLHFHRLPKFLIILFNQAGDVLRKLHYTFYLVENKVAAINKTGEMPWQSIADR